MGETVETLSQILQTWIGFWREKRIITSIYLTFLKYTNKHLFIRDFLNAKSNIHLFLFICKHYLIYFVSDHFIFIYVTKFSADYLVYIIIIICLGYIIFVKTWVCFLNQIIIIVRVLFQRAWCVLIVFICNVHKKKK